MTIGCYQGDYSWQCRTLNADVTIGCYYGDYSSCDNTIPTSFFIWNNFFCSHLCKGKKKLQILIVKLTNYSRSFVTGTGYW